MIKFLHKKEQFQTNIITLTWIVGLDKIGCFVRYCVLGIKCPQPPPPPPKPPARRAQFITPAANPPITAPAAGR